MVSLCVWHNIVINGSNADMAEKIEILVTMQNFFQRMAKVCDNDAVDLTYELLEELIIRCGDVINQQARKRWF